MSFDIQHPLIIISCISLSGPKRCPARFSARHGSSCYFFVPALVNWLTAFIRCRMSGAQLVSIESQEENAYLINYIKKKNHLKCNYYIEND